MGNCLKCGLIDVLCICRSSIGSSSLSNRIFGKKEEKSFSFDSGYKPDIKPLEVLPLVDRPILKSPEIKFSLLGPENPGQCGIGNLEIKTSSHVGPNGDHGEPYPSLNPPTDLIRCGPGPNMIGNHVVPLHCAPNGTHGDRLY